MLSILKQAQLRPQHLHLQMKPTMPQLTTVREPDQLHQPVLLKEKPLLVTNPLSLQHQQLKIALPVVFLKPPHRTKHRQALMQETRRHQLTRLRKQAQLDHLRLGMAVIARLMITLPQQQLQLISTHRQAVTKVETNRQPLNQVEHILKQAQLRLQHLCLRK